MRVLSVTLGLVVLWAWGAAGRAEAQVQRSTGRSGLFGTRSVGGTLSAGTRTFGAGTGRTTQTGASPLGTTSGQLDPSARFVRGSRQPGEFVGAGSEDLAGFIGAVQAGAAQAGRTGPGSLGAQARGTRSSTQGGSSGGRSPTPELRTTLRTDFEFPARSSATAANAIQTRLNEILMPETLPAIRVELSGETARLSGTVATVRERQLAERLVLLEPGIWEVSNELIVAGSAGPTDQGTTGVPAAPRSPAGSPAAGQRPGAESGGDSLPAGAAGPEPQNPFVPEDAQPDAAPATPSAPGVVPQSR